MNKQQRSERFNIARKVMRRVAADPKRKFNLNTWQSFNMGVLCRTEARLEACGTSACFSGWMAVAPEVKELGGTQSPGGALLFDVTEADFDEGNEESVSIANFLGISVKDAISIIYTGKYGCNPNEYDVLNRLDEIEQKYEIM